MLAVVPDWLAPMMTAFFELASFERVLAFPKPRVPALAVPALPAEKNTMKSRFESVERNVSIADALASYEVDVPLKAP